MSAADGTVRVIAAGDYSELATWKLDNGAPTSMAFVVDHVAVAPAGGNADTLAKIVPLFATTAADGSVSPRGMLLKKYPVGAVRLQ